MCAQVLQRPQREKETFTVNHFKADHINRYRNRLIQRTENDFGYSRRRGSGRKPIKCLLNNSKPLSINSNVTIKSHIVRLLENTIFRLHMCKNDKPEDQNCERDQDTVLQSESESRSQSFVRPTSRKFSR